MNRVKVILSDDVYNLGEEGDVREVTAGYARNFLIPQGLALSFSKKNVAFFEQRKESIEKRKDEKREAAKSFREKIESKVIELEMPAGDTGKLFGSVNSATIAEKLAAEGINIERKKIDVPENSIKLIGEYAVRIRLYGDEVAEIKVIVSPVGGKKITGEDDDGTEKKEKEKKEKKKKTKPPAADSAPAEEPVAGEAPSPAKEIQAEDISTSQPAESPADDAPPAGPVETAAAEAAPTEESASGESSGPLTSDTNDESAISEEKSS